jgi:hypothetical protein
VPRLRPRRGAPADIHLVVREIELASRAARAGPSTDDGGPSDDPR